MVVVTYTDVSTSRSMANVWNLRERVQHLIGLGGVDRSVFFLIFLRGFWAKTLVNLMYIRKQQNEIMSHKEQRREKKKVCSSFEMNIIVHVMLCTKLR